MISRIVEVTTPGSYLNVYRGHLVVSRDNQEVGSVPLADVGVLLISTTACSLSVSVLANLIENGSQVIICGKNYIPSGVFLPVSTMLGHYDRLQTQINASLPLKKNLWTKIVESKVLSQIHALEAFGEDAESLRVLIPKILSGDPSNIEAQAARCYWPRLMGPEFKRSTIADDSNVLLNYGYTILRASMIRAIVASGLNPSLPIHHSARSNPAALADDMMEPFRPLVDVIVRKLVAWKLDYLSPDTKVELSSILTMDIYTEQQCSTLPIILQRLCQSYLNSLTIKKESLEYLNLGSTMEELATLHTEKKEDA